MSRPGQGAPALSDTEFTHLASTILDASGISPSGAGWHSLNVYLDALTAEVRLVDLAAGVVGRTRMENSQVIEVSRATHPRRQLFTAAHEVAHLLLEEASYDRSMRTLLPPSYYDTERLCDRLASHILMPEPWMTTVGRAAVRDLAVSITAHRYRLSWAAFIRRVAELGRPALTIHAVRTTTRAWQPVSTFGAVNRVPASGLPLAPLDLLAADHVRFHPDVAPTPWRLPQGVCGEVRTWKHRSATIWFAGGDQLNAP